MRNPYRQDWITRYELDPEVVDCLAFCTKNPAPMLKHLEELKRFHQYWFVTITPYGKDVEPYTFNKCKEEKNTLRLIKEADIQNYQFDGEFQSIDYKEYKNIKINLKGKAQIYNAAESLECVDILKQKGYLINENAIREGLSTVIHKARFEELSNNPKIIFMTNI